MSAGGSFNSSANPYPSGGPIDNQQGLQTSPNPSLPPSSFNPFSGYSGANTGMGGFQQPQYGGFQQPQFGGFGGFGGFQQPQYGGFQQPQYGGFQQPQYGGFQQPQFGGLGAFQQPFDGGYGGGFQQPFSGGFGGQSNRFTRRGQEYTQSYMPQPNQPDYGNMNRFAQPQPMPRAYHTGAYGPNFDRPAPPSRPPPPPGYHYELGQSEPILTAASLTNAPPPVAQELATRQMPQQGGSLLSSLASTGQPTNSDSGYLGFSTGQMDFNPVMGGLGAFGGFQRQFNPYGNAYAEPPQQAQRGTVDQNMNNPAFSMQNELYRQAQDSLKRQADMRMPLPQVEDLVPTEYSVLADLARANGISGPMMTLEESTQGTGNYTGRATDYYKQQLGAKNIDFGESALAPYRQKIIDNMKNVRMRNENVRMRNA